MKKLAVVYVANILMLKEMHGVIRKDTIWNDYTRGNSMIALLKEKTMKVF